MEIVLIDVGALAVFLACMALLYRHGTSQPARPLEHRSPAAPPGAGLRKRGDPTGS